jgi:hypothetical protein
VQLGAFSANPCHDESSRKEVSMIQPRRSGFYAFVLLALALPGCAVPADGEVTTSSSAALCGAALSCEAPPTTSSPADEYELAIDPSQPEIGGSLCRRVCACCARNGNRFCCSHCRFCSGPIGVTDVLQP